MKSFRMPLAIAVVFLVVATPARAGDPDEGKAIEGLIERLALSRAGDYKLPYQLYFYTDMFLPDLQTLEIPEGELDAQTQAFVDALQPLKALVEEGPAAIPHLLRHLDDERGSVARFPSGTPAGSYRVEIDDNWRAPGPGDHKELEPGPWKGDRQERWKSTMTVGDLCFLILGQIVNRAYIPATVQPSNVLVVHSPCEFPVLVASLRKAWNGFDAKRHRALLIQDFLKPDRPMRRAGAYLRLSFYYPDAVEQLVVDYLDGPFYDEGPARRFADHLIRSKLPPKDCKASYDRHVERNGAHSGSAVLNKLIWAHRSADSDKPRISSLVRVLFGEESHRRFLVNAERFWRPADSTDALAYFLPFLTRDKSKAVDQRVLELLVERSDLDVVSACIPRLLGRGFDQEIKGRLEEMIGQWDWNEDERKELRKLSNELGKKR